MTPSSKRPDKLPPQATTALTGAPFLKRHSSLITGARRRFRPHHTDGGGASTDVISGVQFPTPVYEFGLIWSVSPRIHEQKNSKVRTDKFDT